MRALHLELECCLGEYVVELNEIVNWLNDYLEIGNFMEDSSMNGLQVEASTDVKKIAFAVDAGLETFKLAKEQNADLIIVHHGMYWVKSEHLVKGVNAERIRFLMNNKLSLYASHLPLDAHPEVGNNIQIMKKLGFNKVIKFDDLSYSVKLDMNFIDLVKLIEKNIGKVKQFKFGNEKVNTLIVCSGAASHLSFSAPIGSTCLIGEASHTIFHPAKERNLNFIEAGHYVTETFGVKALAEKLKEQFDVETGFIDVPTGM